MKIEFRKTQLNKRSMTQLNVINEIIEDYQSQGYKLTLRQLYYQLVSKNTIPNKDTEYKKLSRLLTEGRMAGIVDWDSIEDRLRMPSNVYHCSDIADALQDTVDQYRLNRMDYQERTIEVWVEKDAISNVLKRVTKKYGINILVNRGYGSSTAMKDAFDRFRYQDDVIILYLGDHDPSGLDMIRDIQSRISNMLNVFGSDNLTVQPIALTMRQIKMYDPPENPAKLTDTRAGDYIERYGKSSWEVDALPPKILYETLENAILQNIDVDIYNEIIEQEKSDKKELQKLVDKYNN